MRPNMDASMVNVTRISSSKDAALSLYCINNKDSSEVTLAYF